MKALRRRLSHFHSIVTILATLQTSIGCNYVAAFVPTSKGFAVRTIYPFTQHEAWTPLRILASPRPSSHDQISSLGTVLLDYLDAIRPVTVIQAVGALTIGHLALVAGQTTAPAAAQRGLLAAAAASVYLSYGAGMVMNDCVDVDVDVRHDSKCGRAIASGKISKGAGWIYCGALSALSLLLAPGRLYALWTASNLVLMLGYAFVLQRLFLVKNVVCAWLAISPLVGAAILTGDISLSRSKLFRLAAVGFPMQFSREILKDIEDMDIDRGKKQTLPLVVGEKMSHRIAYVLVGAVCSAMVFTPIYWEMFASKPPFYAFGVMVGLQMCWKASILPLREGQQLLKKSIFVLLAGMIGGLLAQ
jgi:4-hydroxybenzoate polyprenyltransferase